MSEPRRWFPGSAEEVAARRLSGFLAQHDLADYPALTERAARDPQWFYPAAMDYLGLAWMHPFEQVVDESDGPEWAHWFVGGRTNVAWLALDQWSDRERDALRWHDRSGSVRAMSVAELSETTRAVAGGLRALGIGRGDVVALYLPMVPEAVVAMVAAARIGAVVAPAFSGFGVGALAERLRLGEAKVLVTADAMVRRGKAVDLLSTALSAAGQASSLEAIVVVNSADRHWSRSGTAGPRLVPWANLLEAAPDGAPPQLEAETPLLLGFTSGTTGRPKGVVLSHGGFPYQLAIEMGLCFDFRPGDRLTWITDVGWIMGPISILGPLVMGGTVCLFDEAPDHPTPARLWDHVQAHEVTHVGLSPTLARLLAAHGSHWVDQAKLTSLRVIGSTGEPWTPEAWRWTVDVIGGGHRPLVNWSGGTEIGGGILNTATIHPIVECSFSGPSPGMTPDVYNDDGKPVLDEEGELVLTRSWPGMTRGFWKEPERYLETYWSRWPGVWHHGDRAIRHRDSSWEIVGRSDDVMNIAGKRIGPLEYEAEAAQDPGVAAAAAVAVPHPIKGTVPVVVVVPHAGNDDHQALAETVRDRITANLGRPMRPEVVLAVAELPVTRSGKVHRRALRAWLSDADPGDLSTLENPGIKGAVVAAWKREQG